MTKRHPDESAATREAQKGAVGASAAGRGRRAEIEDATTGEGPDEEKRGAGSAGRRAGVGAHGSAGEDYYYRRKLGRGDLATAAGVALGVGVAAFYVASLFLQRTPLDVPRPPSGRGGRRRGRR